MRDVWLLGSTGSIGTQAMDVIRRNRSSYRIAGLGAGGAHVSLLAQQTAEFAVPVVAIADPAAEEAFRAAIRALGAPMPEVLVGGEAMVELASRARSKTHAPAAAAAAGDPAAADDDVILNGITGSVGLAPTLAALATGATLALANKESLVAGGALVRQAMRRPGQIVPVDSEHSAIFQALQAGVHHRGLTSPNLDGESNVRRIILTASGGPFRGRKRAELASVTVEQALQHPTWNMGPVVTINSATMMNKGLELIEAAYLFDVPPADIVPVVHPQSAVHSMVEFRDGSVLAQASPPDMRLPIALGLSWPQRLAQVAPTFAWAQSDWNAPISWHFEPLDNEAFPAVQLAREALAAGPLFPAVLNAANEQAVAAFVRGELGFLGITDTVARVLESFAAHFAGETAAAGKAISLPQVTAAELWARTHADKLIAQ